MEQWCGIVAWLQVSGLLLDGAGVAILTIDLLPDFNGHRARARLGELRAELWRIVQSGMDALRGPGDPPGLRSEATLEQYAPDQFAKFVRAATVRFDLERLQWMLLRAKLARDPLSPLGGIERVPADLENFHRRFSSFCGTLEIEWPGDRWRPPLYLGILVVIGGFALQLVGSVPWSHLGCPA